MSRARKPALPILGLGLAGVLFSPAAHGVGRVLSENGTAIVPSAVRVVQTRSAGPSTEWLSLAVQGGPGRFALVVPVPEGTAVDPAFEAWIDALDFTTAPRIRPPSPVLECGATHSGTLEDTSTPSAATLVPSGVAVLDGPSAVASYALQQGFAFSSADTAQLAALGPTRFVAIAYDLPSAEGSIATLRFASPVPMPDLPVGLLGSLALPELTVFTIGEGRARYSAVPELPTSELLVTWHVLAGQSDFATARQSYLASLSGAATLIEASGSTPLVGWNVLPGGAGAIAPGVKSYFERAKKEGASVNSVDLCSKPVWDAVESGKLGARVGRVCAPGALALVPSSTPSTCDENPGAGEISGGALRCGDAADAALAFAGMQADKVRLTRHTMLIGTETPLALSPTVAEGASVSLLVTCDVADSTGCLPGAGGSGGTHSGGAGYGGQGGLGASTGYDPLPTPEPDPQVNVDVSCWSNLGDSCSGDGSDSSSDSGCSGDSSSESEGDTCSGDSSSDGGDSCGGDSSSSEGDTCSGDSSGGADGDTCSGDSGGGDSCGSGSSGSSGDCAVRPRPRRLKISALSLVLAALALPLRRRGRQKRRRY